MLWEMYLPHPLKRDRHDRKNIGNDCWGKLLKTGWLPASNCVDWWVFLGNYEIFLLINVCIIFCFFINLSRKCTYTHADGTIDMYVCMLLGRYFIWVWYLMFEKSRLNTRWYSCYLNMIFISWKFGRESQSMQLTSVCNW